MPSGIFITGTSTGVGKTFISALIMSAATSAGLNVHYWKPLQTGNESDCDTVKEFTGLPEDSIVRPFMSWEMPAAPYRAALAEKKAVDPQEILRYWQTLADTTLVVEGAGGLMVPITKDFYMRDLIKMLNLPLLIAATTILGTVNHTLLTIEAAQQANVPVAGMVLSGPADPGLREFLQQLTSVPILLEVPWFETIVTQDFNEAAQTLVDQKLLERIFNNAPTILV